MAKPMPDLDPEKLDLNDLLGVSMRGNHPRPELLLACEQGVLPPEPQARIAQHLKACALCTMLLADLATLPEEEVTPAQLARIGARLPLAEQQPSAARRWGLVAAIAAVVVLGVSASLALHHQNPPPPVAQSVPTSVATVAALEIPLKPLAPPGPDATALVTRGAHQGSDPTIAQLMPAFNAYNKADYKTAAASLAPLTQSYPHSRIVRLYLGVSELYLHQDREAYADLALVRAAKPLDADAIWYSAIAAQRLNSGDARQLLESLCTDGTSAYASESCRIAPTLH